MSQMFTNDSLRWPFSHFYHGLLVDELKLQGVATVSFDVYFAEADREKRYPVGRRDGTNSLMISGQDFFAGRLRRNGNVILAAGVAHAGDSRIQLPVSQLATNATVGHVGVKVDRDGVIRRLMPLITDTGTNRYWALGIELAAKRLGLDLNQADVTPERVVVRGTNGLTREIPLDARQTLLLDWGVHPGHPLAAQQVQVVKYEEVINSAIRRGKGEAPADLGLARKIVAIGAGGTGVNLYDRGNNSLRNADVNCFAHVAVANSLLTGQFVRTTPRAVETGIALCMVGLATLAGWRLRTVSATVTTLLAAAAYSGLAVWCYTYHRLLLPVALPVLGALVTTHLVMTACRTLENAERRRLEHLLKKVVSPKIIDTLLQLESPTPQTRRMEITVLFADLRGFTRFSEESQTQAEAAARALGLPPEQARAFADEAAREAMSSVNRYLAAVVDEIKATDGTLDKYMGDCVMAFWGAPLEDEHHAAHALKCAIAAEQSLEQIHREFTAENKRREQENQKRKEQQLPPLPYLPVLRLGIGLNSGLATVGFMGSENHLSSYTAFGHIVNVASRVEGLAGGGQIVATEHTVISAGRNHPDMVERCAELSPVLLKGISTPVKVFQIRWQETASAPAAAVKA